MGTKISKGRGYTYLLPLRFVWATRECVPVLSGGIETEVAAYIQRTAGALSVDSCMVDVAPDFVRIDALCRPQITPADAVKVLKGNTARWLFMEHPEVKKQMPEGHLWDASYLVQCGSFSGDDPESSAYLEDIRKKAGKDHG